MYNVHLTHSLLCFEFIEFTLLTFKRSSIGCRQEYWRETATICAPRLYIWGMSETSYFAPQNKLFSWAKQVILKSKTSCFLY